MRGNTKCGLALGAAFLTALAGCAADDGPQGTHGFPLLSSLVKTNSAAADGPATDGLKELPRPSSAVPPGGASPAGAPASGAPGPGGSSKAVSAAASPPLRGSSYGIAALMARAMRDNPSLRIKASKVQSASNQVKVAKLQFLATPAVSVEDAVSQGDKNLRGNETVTVLRVQQPLWTGGRLTAGLRRAKAGVEVSEADFDHERQGVSLGILEKYGQWLSAKLKREAMQDGEKLYRGLGELIDRRVDAGASAESDILILQSRVDQLRVSINQMETIEGTSIAALSQYLGGPLTAGELAQDLSGPKIDIAQGPRLIEQARQRSPLLRRLAAEVKMADQGVAKARSSLSPEIYVRAQRQYGRSDYKIEEPQDSVFVGVQSQFGAGFSNVLDIQGAQYDRDAAKLAIRSGELSLIEQMSSDLAVASTIDARISNLQNAVESTALTKESSDRQFVAGRKTWLDVMNAAREHMDMKVQLAEAKATAVIVKWRLRILSDGVNQYLPDMKGERN